MSRTAAALAGLALLACTSCARPVTPPGTLAPQAANGVGQGTPLPFGPPARPGLDGPIPQAATEVPATPFVGDAPMQRTTAELMRAAAFAAPASTADRPVVRKVRPNRRSLPADSGSPPGSRGPVDLFDALLASAAPSAPMPAAPNVDLVNSTENAGYTPPDTMGDVGPAQYLTIVNGRMRTVDKATGAADGVIDVNPDVFFAAVRNGQATGDPRVRYDRRSGRWFVLAFTIAVPNRYVLAVSDGATITGSTVWTYHRWANTHLATTTGNGCLGDYPTLGIDDNALYIGVNQFCGTSVSGSLAWDGSTGYVVRKATLPGSLVVSLFDNLLTNTSGAGPYTPQGVDNRDANTTTGYFIGVDGFATGKLAMRRVLDPGGTPSISANVAIGAAQGVLATAMPTDVAQPGVVQLLSGGDDRLMNAVIRNGRLWTVHQVEVGSTGSASASGGRNGERWYELQDLGTTAAAAAPTVRQTGTVFDAAPSSPNSFWMGTLDVTGQGHVTLGMSRAGASTSSAAATTGFANAAVSGRLATDPLGMMGAPALYTANTAFTLTAYNGGIGTTVKRWGDYSSTSVDPDDDMTTWTVQEYLSANDRWAIRLVRIPAPPPAALVSLSPASVPAGQTDLAVTVTGSAAGGAGFFDPGAGFARRIAAAFSGSGVVVTDVAVDTATQLTLTLDTTGAATGSRTLTVTNPDGQLMSLANALSVTPPSNVAPLAADDAYQTPFGLTLTVAAPGVLANDSDADLDALSARLVAAPSSGTLALDADGSFSFTPAAGFAGEVSFTYRASDGVSSSAASTVTLTVAENAAPSLSTFANRSIFDTGAGPGVASGPIAMTVGDLEAGAAAVTVSASSSNQAVVATGNLTVSGSGASRMLAFTTVPGAAGATTIAVAASDGVTTTTRSFMVTLTRSTPPVAVADSFATGRGQAVTVPPPGVLANDSDADGQPLTAVLVSPPAAGSFTLALTGGVSYTPDPGATGPATFTYRASDGVLTSEVVTGTITVSANALPVITAPPSLSVVDEGSGVTIGPLPFSVGNPDGDSPAVTVTSSNPEALAPAAIVLGGSGASRTITLTSPAGGPGGTTTITLSASDGLVTSTATFVVTVLPRRGTPARLSAVVARNSVVFAWAPPPVSLEPITGYVLEAGAAPGAPFVALPLGDMPALTLSVPDGAFFVRLRTMTPGGVSPPSNEVRIATGQAAPPLAPGALLATVQGSAMTLQWAENPLGPVITAYQLQAGTSAGASDLGVMPLPGTARRVSAAGGPGPYFVRLAAANAAGAGPVSNEVVLAPGPGVCTRPATPSGVAAATRPGGVTVTWSAPVDGGIPAGYHVELGTAPGAANGAAAVLPVTTSVGGGLAPGTYYLRLSASNACGASAAAPEIAFTVP